MHSGTQLPFVRGVAYSFQTLKTIKLDYPRFSQALSNRLYDILNEESNRMTVLESLPEERKKEASGAKSEEEEEDFLDECK